MERKEINQFNMQKTTYKVLDSNRSVFDNNPLITAKVDQLNTFNVEIAALSDIQTAGTKGDNTTKEQAEVSLISSILIVAGGLLAHASTTNDAKIKEIASVTENSLKRLRDNDLSSHARIILTAAKSVIASLDIWGVVQTNLDKLESDITTFDEIIPGNTASKAEVKQSTDEIKLKIKEAKTLLKDQLDPMMLPFKTLNPTFYGQYENARQIIDTAASHSTEDSTTADQQPSK